MSESLKTVETSQRLRSHVIDLGLSAMIGAFGGGMIGEVIGSDLAIAIGAGAAGLIAGGSKLAADKRQVKLEKRNYFGQQG